MNSPKPLARTAWRRLRARDWPVLPPRQHTMVFDKRPVTDRAALVKNGNVKRSYLTSRRRRTLVNTKKRQRIGPARRQRPCCAKGRCTDWNFAAQIAARPSSVSGGRPPAGPLHLAKQGSWSALLSLLGLLGRRSSPAAPGATGWGCGLRGRVFRLSTGGTGGAGRVRGWEIQSAQKHRMTVWEVVSSRFWAILGRPKFLPPGVPGTGRGSLNV